MLCLSSDTQRWKRPLTSTSSTWLWPTLCSWLRYLSRYDFICHRHTQRKYFKLKLKLFPTSVFAEPWDYVQVKQKLHYLEFRWVKKSCIIIQTASYFICVKVCTNIILCDRCCGILVCIFKIDNLLFCAALLVWQTNERHHGLVIPIMLSITKLLYLYGFHKHSAFSSFS